MPVCRSGGLGRTGRAVAGSPERGALARAAGAEIVYGPDDWFDAVVVDPVGGHIFEQSVRCLAADGRMLTLDYTSGRIRSAAAHRLLLRNAGVLGVGWSELLRVDEQLFGRTAELLAGLVQAGPFEAA